MTAPANNWTTRQQVYDVSYKYPNMFAITKLTQDDKWWIVSKENGNYFIIGSDSKTPIDPNDLQSVKCFDTLYAQMTGTGVTDASQFIWSDSDLQPV